MKFTLSLCDLASLVKDTVERGWKSSGGERGSRPVASASPARELSLYPTGGSGEPLHTSEQGVTCAKLVEESTAVRMGVFDGSFGERWQ